MDMNYPKMQIIPGSGTCRDLLQCVFNLNPLEVKIYSILVKEGPMRSDEVAEKINRHQSTAHRCLRHLVSCNICNKERHYLEMGGHYYVYSANPPGKVKESLEICIDAWHRKIHSNIEEFINKFEVEDKDPS